MHVRMLAAGLADHGIAVSVLGPRAADARFAFTRLPGVTFTPAEIGRRPRPGDAVAVVRLRRLLRGCDVAHAHGLRAGALTVLALAGAGPLRRPALVVTAHNAPPGGRGAAAVTYRVLERIVARGADQVLCVSGDLAARMRASGARRVDRAIVPPPDALPDVPPGALPGAPPVARPGLAGAGPAGAAAAGRPVVQAVGRLAAQKGFGTLLEAAAGWRDLDPVPVVVIAGDGPLAAELRAKADALGVDAAFLDHVDDVPAVLAGAAVFVLPSRWEGQPLALQEALRAGLPIVATQVGGVPDLTGEEAALLIPPGDPARLAAAVRAVLTDPALATRLRAAARERAAALPVEADAVNAALTCYDAMLSERAAVF